MRSDESSDFVRFNRIDDNALKRLHHSSKRYFTYPSGFTVGSVALLSIVGIVGSCDDTTFESPPSVWVDSANEISVPVWCPPTPPQGDGDVYCDAWARALYRAGPAADALLPPAPRRERPTARPPRPRPAARVPHAPLSLFERGGGRRGARARAPPAPHPHPAPQPDWTPAEDAALRRALRLQRLPPEPPAALAPNWDWVAELVAEPARAFRSPRACRDRHDALADPERARRRHRRPPPPRRRVDADPPRPPLHRLDAVRDAAERRRQAPRRRPDDAPPRNPKHAALLADHGVDYDSPPTPMDVATRRAERIAREKLKAHAPPPVSAAAAPAPAPPRIVVAAAAAAEPARRPPPRAPAPQLLYRQQTFPARHLKILHQAPTPHPQQQAGEAAGRAAGGGEGARKVQLAPVSLRRAPAPAPHVVVAHLAPRAPDAPPRQ